MKVSFSKPDSTAAAGTPGTVVDVPSQVISQTPPVAAPAPEAPAVPAPAAEIPTQSAVDLANQTSAVVPSSPAMFDDNDIAFDQIRVPTLNLVHHTGELKDIFNPGELIYNGTLVLYSPKNDAKKLVGTAPLRIVPIGFRKLRYVEKVSGGGKGDLVNTVAEVVSLGGTLDYNQWKRAAGKMKRFEELSTLLLLIEKPDHLEDIERQVFVHVIEDKRYAIVIYNLKGTAYTGVAKTLFTARKMGFLSKTAHEPGEQPRAYSSFFWTLETEPKTFTQDGKPNTIPVPVIKASVKTSEKLRAFVIDGLGFGPSK